MLRSLLLVAAAAAISLLRPVLPEAAPAAPRGFERFRMLVWQYKTPPPGVEAKRLYESLNLNGIHLDNGFAPGLLRFARENGYAFYADHAAGKGDLHLHEADWER